MFTLRHQTNYSAPNNLSFYSLNKAEMTDTEMDAITDDIVNGLFAVCVTLGTIPVIRCPKNGAAEYVSKKLDKKLRENLRDTRNSLFLNEGGMQGGGQFSFHRPLLVRHFLNLRGVSSKPSGKHLVAPLFGFRDFYLVIFKFSLTVQSFSKIGQTSY